MPVILRLKLTPAQHLLLVEGGLYGELGCNPKMASMSITKADVMTIIKRVNSFPVSRTGDAILRKAYALRHKFDAD